VCLETLFEPFVSVCASATAKLARILRVLVLESKQFPNTWSWAWTTISLSRHSRRENIAIFVTDFCAKFKKIYRIDSEKIEVIFLYRMEDEFRICIRVASCDCKVVRHCAALCLYVRCGPSHVCKIITTDMDNKWATTKYITTALVYQPCWISCRI